MARVLEKKESSLMFRQISPPYKWDRDLHSHYLRLTVPGFSSKDISLHMDKYGDLVVRGSREVSQHKHLSFEETFNVSDDGDLEQAEGLFEDDQIYCVTIPKKKELALGHGDGGSKSEGVKLEDPAGKDNITCPKPVGPSPVISKDKSKKEIAFLIAVILISIFVAWLSPR